MSLRRFMLYDGSMPGNSGLCVRPRPHIPCEVDSASVAMLVEDPILCNGIFHLISGQWSAMPKSGASPGGLLRGCDIFDSVPGPPHDVYIPPLNPKEPKCGIVVVAPWNSEPQQASILKTLRLDNSSFGFLHHDSRYASSPSTLYSGL